MRWLNLFLWGSFLGPVQAQVIIPQASTPQRLEQRQAARNALIPSNYDLTRHPATEQAHWRGVLWSMTLVQPTDPPALAALAALLDLGATPNPAPALQPTLQQALKTSAALYVRPVQPETRTAYAFIPTKLQNILQVSREPGLIALALTTLTKGGSDPTPWLAPLKDRLPLWFMDPQLRTTLEELSAPTVPLPPLGDLLNHQVASLPHFYLLCRPDRSVPCLGLLKDGQGQFLREAEGLWSVSLLAKSVYPLAWNFNSGETPQGLLRLEGLKPRGPSEFRAFGQFPSFKVFLPFEPGATQFIPGVPANTPLDLGIYRSLWPRSWQDYRPIEQSFWAGRVGRNLIRIHGSGEDPSFFYPQPVDLPNPTIGCIAALEQYGPDGQLLRADLPRLLNAWDKVQPGGSLGYLWLIEVPATTDQMVTLEEVAPLVPPSIPS
ncbi:hypothetical protein [Candidatus Cyanaurora vandensis]|uniref:hypothetical protein n=1 Tax=Candidatus Cyanaurora vandensis TaxID=2714958 RepID=UPI002579EAF7|nr:hypothetical protein [Candidatus Cyanaurora vandensis]